MPAAPAPDDARLEQVRQLMLGGYKWMEPPRKTLIQTLLGGLKSFSQEKKEGPSVTERRRSVRMSCEYDVRCSAGDRTFEACVLDIGLTGLRLYSEYPLQKGQVIRAVPFSGGGPVPCVVSWVRRLKDKTHMSGLYFDLRPTELVRSWVAVLLAELGFNEEAVLQRRSLVRASADLPVQIRTPSDEVLQGRVFDIGIGGTLIQVSRPDAPAQGNHRLLLGPYRNLDMLSISAQVVRVSLLDPGDRVNVGYRFVNPNAAQVRLLGAYVLDLLGRRHGLPG